MEEMAGAQPLLVRQMTWEADRVLSVVLVREDGQDLPEWTYGAHIDLVLQPNLIRQYSLCSRPENRKEFKIAVLREDPGSGGSDYVHDMLRPGMTVPVAGPRNNYPMIDADQYLIIAGGIGITPLLPMAFALADRDVDWRLLYAGGARSSMAFIEELTELGNRVVIAPKDESGRIDLKAEIQNAAPRTEIYCCGPERLIASVEELCLELGRPAPRIERFKARPGHAVELEAEHLEDTEFEVVLANSNRRFTIPIDRTIVEVLREKRVFVPTSCTEGYCGVCETEVISGVPNHRDDYLTPEKRALNKTIMLCCSRSKTPEIVIAR